jgi:hypothetical protein
MESFNRGTIPNFLCKAVHNGEQAMTQSLNRILGYS